MVGIKACRGQSGHQIKLLPPLIIVPLDLDPDSRASSASSIHPPVLPRLALPQALCLQVQCLLPSTTPRLDGESLDRQPDL